MIRKMQEIIILNTLKISRSIKQEVIFLTRIGIRCVSFQWTPLTRWSGENIVGKTLYDFLEPLTKVNIGMLGVRENVDLRRQIIFIYSGNASDCNNIGLQSIEVFNIHISKDFTSLYLGLIPSLDRKGEIKLCTNVAGTLSSQKEVHF